MDELELLSHCIRLQPQLFSVFYWDFMQSYEAEGMQYMSFLLEKPPKQLKSCFLAYLHHIYTSKYWNTV